MGSRRDQKASTAKEPAPPLLAFLRLLEDPAREADLKRILHKYPDPALQWQLRSILQDVMFSHGLRTTRGKLVSGARAWFNKRDRWRARVSKLDTELEALLIQFRESIYPVLRASKSLTDGYSRDIADLFLAIQRVQQLTNSSQILSRSFTARGHQKQPYLAGAVKAMRALRVTKADAEDLLVLVGVSRTFSPRNAPSTVKQNTHFPYGLLPF